MSTNKKLFALATSIILMMGVSFGAGTITGSAHDFSSASWNSTGEICVTCHTPHNADVSVSDSPLWNHQVTSSTFTLYSNSVSLDATLGQPNGISKLCLSCHDGSVALDNFGGNTGGATNIADSLSLGTNLANDHPVSFTYDATLASDDGELFDPTTQNSGLGGTIAADMLVSNKLECSSCHDVHNGSGLSKLLVKSNTSSALCLTCHNK
ncbi:MAG: cytochrome c3 family protein [FCB group bacterium]|nr:cytochrome c3 family protein [FCB group bacterium]